jgi:hypothetical protein
MSQCVEVYQPMPDNLIRIQNEGGGKRVEILADYKEEDHFSVCLTATEADWLASELKSPSPFQNWKRLENGQVLSVERADEVRQLILSDIRGGRKVQAGRGGVILEERLDQVIEPLKTVVQTAER